VGFLIVFVSRETPAGRRRRRLLGPTAFSAAQSRPSQQPLWENSVEKASESFIFANFEQCSCATLPMEGMGAVELEVIW
jgi:hypothetical protein